MSEDFSEAMGMGDAKEATPGQIEQMKENMKKADEAIKKSKKDEGKKKKKEKKVVEIIVRFLQSGDDQDVLGLIVLLLEQGVPVGFILSILSIAYDEVEQELVDALEAPERKLLSSPEEREKALELSIEKKEKQTFDKNKLPQYFKDRINEWVRLLFLSALEERVDVLENFYPNDNLTSSGHTLAALMVKKYCENCNIEIELDDAKDFALFILSGLKNQMDINQKAKKITEGD